MDTSNKAKLLERLEAARRKYVGQLAEKIDRIFVGWEKILAKPTDTEEMGDLHRQVHTMAGSAGTFGLQEVGQAAREVEILLKGVVQGEYPLERENVERIALRLATLKSLADRVTSVADFQGVSEEKDAEVASVVQGKLPDDQRGRSIFVVDNDLSFAHTLCKRLRGSGYFCLPLTTLRDFRREMVAHPPAVVVISNEMSDGDATTEIESVRLRISGRFSTIILSSQGDLARRLDGIRAGGQAYFQKPFEVEKLLETLETLISIGEENPYRILIVEDAEPLAEHYAQIVQEAGMKACVVTDPMQAMKPLITFQPDLILMDLYMPECNGWELAGVIRQQSDYLMVPIVFLSGESDIDRQFMAMSLGGDGFLTKPIEPAHLIASVRSRIERARQLRAMMTRRAGSRGDGQ